MGFLLGAYSKQMAGKRVRSLQARMVHVQSRLRRATRDIEQREKYWSRVEKDLKNQTQMNASAMSANYSAQLQASVWAQAGLTQEQQAAIQRGDWSSVGAEAASIIGQQLQMANTQNAQKLQMIQAAMQQTAALQEQEIEMAKEADLQPIKDLEDELQTEKDSLESQIQIAQQDYEACKEMEKAGVKSLTPNYTGGQG